MPPVNRRLAIVALLGLLALTVVVGATGASDVDGDGLTALDEIAAGTSVTDADSDGDGLADGVELHEHDTDPQDRDTDDDGLADGAEVEAHGSDPLVADSDDDGLTDGLEVEDHETDPTDADTDGDGLADGAEVSDHDTNPRRADTDGDSLEDGREVKRGTDPTAPDSDDDGLRDGPEVDDYETDPLEADTDGDGLDDGPEVEDHGTDPLAADTDGDGLDDGSELAEHDTDPLAADTDADGLADGPEVDRGTDPTDVDTDGDGLEDGAEVHVDALSAADPLRMDVFVEVDWMTGEKPSRAELSRVTEAYADAPVSNPDGSTGIDLHVVYSNELPKEADTTSADLLEIMDAHMDFEDRGYHYAVAIDTTPKADVGGFTLAGHDNTPFAIKTDAKPGYYYPDGWIPHVFMHELGHGLGIASSAYEGVDSEEIPYDTYSSAMNYNAPLEELQYNAGGPFDDWEHIEENLLTPTVAS